MKVKTHTKWDTMQTNVRGKITALAAYTRKVETAPINNYAPEGLGKPRRKNTYKDQMGRDEGNQG